jgi:hypothetical protein
MTRPAGERKITRTITKTNESKIKFKIIPTCTHCVHHMRKTILAQAENYTKRLNKEKQNARRMIGQGHVVAYINPS